jgi:hypothetical protein
MKAAAMDERDQISRYYERASELRIRAHYTSSARKADKLIRKANRRITKAKMLEARYRQRYGHGPFEIGPKG